MNKRGFIDEINPIAFVFGILCAALIFFLRKWMLNPFLTHMSTGSAIFWGALTYIACFIVGYLIGLKMFAD